MTVAFDELASSASPLARIDPRWKLLTLAPALVLTSLLREPLPVAAALALTTALVLAARFPRRFLLTRLGAVFLFLLPFLIILPLQEGRAGLLPALTITARALTIVFLALGLAASTPFTDLLKAAQALGAPGLFTRMALLTYRYVFVLADDFARLRTAIMARGFRNRTSRHSYATIGRVTGTLLVRSAERAERVAHAMHCRGFDGKHRTLNGFHTRASDVLFFGVIIAAAIGLLVWDWYCRE